MIDNHEAVKMGNLEKTSESLSLNKPKFTTAFLEAVVRDGAHELTLRRGQEGTQRTFNRTTKRWRPPLGDEDIWHATCHAIFKGIEGEV